MKSPLSEIFMIRSTLLPEEFHWRGTSSEAEKWEGSLKDFEETGEDSEEIPGNLSFGTRLSNDPAPEVWLNVELPNDQQKKEGATDENEAGQPSLTLSGTTCPRDELNALNEVMENRLKESTKEGLDNRIFDVITSLQSHLADFPLKSLSQTQEKVEEKQDVQENDEILMARVIFWTHHLKAPSKRKDFAAWCPELDIWGITKLGYPGFLCWEGAAPDVDEMVKRVKGLQWAALSLRSDVRWIYSRKGITVVNNLEAATDRFKYMSKGLVTKDLFQEALKNCYLSKGHPGMKDYLEDGNISPKTNFKTSLEEVESVKELVERFRSMEVPEQEFVDAFSLRA